MEELINEMIDPAGDQTDNFQNQNNQEPIVVDDDIIIDPIVVTPVPPIEPPVEPPTPEDVPDLDPLGGSIKGGNCICSCDLTCTRA